MAAGRMIQRRISKSHDVVRLIESVRAEMGGEHGPLAALLFTWCIAHQDVDGRMHGDPRLVRGEVFPLLEEVTAAHVATYLKHMHDVGLVLWYEADKRRWLSFPGFGKSQPGLRKEKEAPSVIPPPDQGVPINSALTPELLRSKGAVTPGAIEENRSSNEVNGSSSSNLSEPATDAAFSAFWGSATGELVQDPWQIGEVFKKIHAYAAATEQILSEVVDAAISAFRAEVASWNNTRPLTAALFNKKWPEVQARMGGKVPAQAAAAKPKGTELLPSRSRPAVEKGKGGQRDLSKR